MKFYDCPTAPSPRRVRIFLAEKGLDIPTVNVDLAKGEHFSEDFRRRNPTCTVPTLELDDGTCIYEAVAVCRYLDEAYPDNPLMGDTPKAKAVIEMWNHRVESEGFMAVAEGFRNKASGFKGRALPGTHTIEQIPELVERGRLRYEYFLQDLNDRLAESRYIAGDDFSIADITALVAIDFGSRAVKVPMPEDYTHLRRWYDAVSSRPGTQV